jgi:hypothetical protein
LKKEDKESWLEKLKKVIGYYNLFDFYELKDKLGSGKFGEIF